MKLSIATLSLTTTTSADTAVTSVQGSMLRMNMNLRRCLTTVSRRKRRTNRQHLLCIQSAGIKRMKNQFQEYKINKDSKKDGGNNDSSCIINNYSFGVSASTLSLPSAATPTLGITTFTHIIYPNRYHSSV